MRPQVSYSSGIVIGTLLASVAYCTVSSGELDRLFTCSRIDRPCAALVSGVKPPPPPAVT